MPRYLERLAEEKRRERVQQLLDDLERDLAELERVLARIALDLARLRLLLAESGRGETVRGRGS